MPFIGSQTFPFSFSGVFPLALTFSLQISWRHLAANAASLPIRMQKTDTHTHRGTQAHRRGKDIYVFHILAVQFDAHKTNFIWQHFSGKFPQIRGWQLGGNGRGGGESHCMTVLSLRRLELPPIPRPEWQCPP